MANLQGMSPAERARLASHELYEWKTDEDLCVFLDKARVGVLLFAAVRKELSCAFSNF
jgi:hypothetical protein